MKNPKESNEKVIIKPRPPKGLEEAAPVDPICPEAVEPICPAAMEPACQAEPVGPEAAPAAGQGGSSWSFLLMLALMFVVMYLFMIRPQRQQQKKLEEMRNALKKGDKVITAGGIYGTIADVDDRTVLVKVDGEVKIRVDKSSINKDTTAEAPAQPEKK